jgi:hypothetical protein
MDQSSNNNIFSVTERGECIGFVISRGPMGVEAFTTTEESIGIYAETDDAVVMIWRYAHNQGTAGNLCERTPCS